MEKRNPIIKKAFEEAAKKELAALPEEKFVIRNFSSEFENKIHKIIDDKTDKKEYSDRSKSRKFKWSVLVAAALMCVLVIGVSAGEFIQTFSHEWRGRLTENIQNAAVGEGVEEFDAEYEISTDPFAIAGRESGAGKHILLDYDQSIKYNDVIAEDEGYRFELKSITKARQKHRVMTGGRISDGTATYEWTVSEAYYAIIEFSRADGKKLEKEDEDLVLAWNFLLEGYKPSSTNMCFRGNAIKEYSDEYAKFFAVEITDMMPFAGLDFALVPIEAETTEFEEAVYMDKDGTMELLNSEEYIGTIIRFSVDEKYADKNAAKDFLNNHCMNEIK